LLSNARSRRRTGGGSRGARPSQVV
jgi:hypothetical protein